MKNGIVQTIVVTKHTCTNLKRPEVLLSFDYQNDSTNEEKYMMFVNELELFSISIISSPLKTLQITIDNTIQIEKTTKTTNAKTKPFCNFKNSVEIVFDKQHEVSLENKVYPKTYYHHTLG